jgi:hypothetical protein
VTGLEKSWAGIHCQECGREEDSAEWGCKAYLGQGFTFREGEPLRERLPAFLMRLEVAGVTRFRGGRSGDERIERAAAAAPGIEKANQGGTDFPGSICVMPELPIERSAS